MVAEMSFAQLEDLARRTATTAKASRVPVERMQRMVKKERVFKSGWFRTSTEIIEVPDTEAIVVGWKLYQHPVCVVDNCYSTDYGVRTESERENRHVWLHEDGRLIVIAEVEQYKTWGPPYHLGSKFSDASTMSSDIAAEEGRSGALREYGSEDTMAGAITTQKWRVDPGEGSHFALITGHLERLLHRP